MTSPWGKGELGKATELHSKIVRALGYCEKCGTSGVRLECSHIIGRRHGHVRTDLLNAFCLCHNCHQWFTDHPPDHTAFIYEKRGKDVYEHLLARSLDTSKVDWSAEVERLKPIWKQLEVSA